MLDSKLDPGASLPGKVGLAIAAGRVALGVVAVVAPRPTGRLLLGDPAAGTAVAVRMVGARDLALGLGALLAARRGAGALRGWVEAGMIADAGDALAFATNRALHPALRVGTVVVAGGTAVVSSVVARRLTT